MRLLEILLAGFISVQICIVVLKMFNDKKQRLFYVAISLFILILHLLFEGYRWQMIPAYMTFIIVSLIQIRNKNLRKFYKVFQSFVLIFLLVLSISLPSILPILHFKTTGDYHVGVRNYKLRDENREEIITQEAGDIREVSVRVFYPTPSNTKGTYPYNPEYDQVKHTYKKKLGWPTMLIDYLKLFKVRAQENAQSFEGMKFPIVFYSHGLANNYTEAQGRLSEIASHGYIVIAINHTYSSDFAILSSGDVVGYKALSLLGDSIKKVDSVKTIIAQQWVNDVNFTRDEMKKSSLAQTIDFNNIALLGFSAGGTMASLGGYTVNNVKAAINLDGTPRGIDTKNVSKSPQLIMLSEPEVFSDAQIKAWGITREDIEAPIRLINERAKAIVDKAPEGSEIIRIPGSKHSNFIEYPLISPLSHYLDIGGKIDSKECYEFINTKIVKFLDENLKN